MHSGRFTWLNGRLVPSDQAVLPFMTAALHYGIAVFEGIRCYSAEGSPAIFRLREHMERLLGSARLLGFRELPYTAEELCAAACETVRASTFEACYIRPLIYLSNGGWNLTVDSGTPSCGIAVWRWDAYLGKQAAEEGVRANISSVTRHHPNVSLTKAKISGNYVNSVLAKTESLRLGFDEAILLDPQGYVAECTGENIFIVRRGRVITPPAAAILEGITRESVMTLAADCGFEVSEEPMSRDQLYLADEVFVTGTAAEIIALREIDFRTIGSGRMGPVTRELQQAFQDSVQGRHPRSAEWLTYVSADVEARR